MLSKYLIQIYIFTKIVQNKFHTLFSYFYFIFKEHLFHKNCTFNKNILKTLLISYKFIFALIVKYSAKK